MPSAFAPGDIEAFSDGLVEALADLGDDTVHKVLKTHFPTFRRPPFSFTSLKSPGDLLQGPLPLERRAVLRRPLKLGSGAGAAGQEEDGGTDSVGD